MIKTITKKIFVCDMCGHEYSGSKDLFEFTVNLEDGVKNIQICPSCQAKLKNALGDKLDKIYEFKGFCCILPREEKGDD